MNNKYRIYILGPMTGIVDYNFKEFDDVANEFRASGFDDVVSPTDLDRELGFDPKNLPEGYSDWHKSPPGFEHINWIANGITAAMTCNAYIALPGWENSKGANAEKNALDAIGAKWLNEPVKNSALVKETICEEAQKLTSNDRQSTYGHPLDNFTIAATMMNARFKTKFTPEDMAEIQIIFKIARQANAPKRDNLVDIAGYANTWGMVIDEREQRASVLSEE